MCPAMRIATANCTKLINANGDMSNNIATKLAVAAGNVTSGQRYLVSAMWDWGPIASWDGGASWPVGDWNPNKVIKDDQAAAAVRAVEVGLGQHEVQLETSKSTLCGVDLENCFWLPIPALPELGIMLNEQVRATTVTDASLRLHCAERCAELLG